MALDCLLQKAHLAGLLLLLDIDKQPEDRWLQHQHSAA
jgi:hypothetical protein